MVPLAFSAELVASTHMADSRKTVFDMINNLGPMAFSKVSEFNSYLQR